MRFTETNHEYHKWFANSNQTTEIKPEKVVSLFPANLVRIFFIYGCLYRERHVHFATSDSGCKVFSKAGGFLQRMYVAGDFTLFICSCMFCFLHCQSFPTLDPSIVFPEYVALVNVSQNLPVIQLKFKAIRSSWHLGRPRRCLDFDTRRGWRREGWRDVSKKQRGKTFEVWKYQGQKGIFFAETTRKKGNKNKEKDHWILWKKGGLRGEIWDVFEAPKGFMYTLAVQSLRAERRLVDDDVNSLQQHVFLCQRASGDHISHVKSHVF